MINVLAHRALFDGQDNSLKGVKHYLNLGIGIEIDLRYDENGVYVSHDKHKNEELFENFCKLCSKSNITMALHVKEIEAVNETVKLIDKYAIKNYFLFNTDGNDLSKIINHGIIGEHLSQKSKITKHKNFWCDEVDKKWFNEKLISKLHKNHNLLYTMSLEGIRTCSKEEMVAEWKRLIKLGIDGICTNYPEELVRFSKGDLN